jgi:hypothetical protein
MTAAGFFMRGQAIPDYMQRDMDRGTFGYYANGDLHTERNPFDFVSDFTPLGLVNDARNVIKGIGEGDLGKVGWGLAGAVPGIGEARSAGKALKVMDKAGKAVKPIAKNVKRATDLYGGIGQGVINKYNPLNLVKGYGSKLESKAVPLGNVLEDAVKSGNVTLSQSPLTKMYYAALRKKAPTMTAGKNNKDIFQLGVEPNVPGSNIKIGSQVSKWNPLTSKKYDVRYGRQSATEIPLNDPGVSVYRRLPFSTRVAKVDPIKLANNQSQWATQGAGLQNIAEKYGSTLLGASALTAAAMPIVGKYYGFQPGLEDYKYALSDVLNTYRPDRYFSKPDYKSIGSIYYIVTGGNRNLQDDIYNLFKQDGGAIEMDADQDTIDYLRSQGYTVEDLD